MSRNFPLPAAARLSSGGSRCSPPVVVCSLVGLLLMINLYYFVNHKETLYLSHQLEKVEEVSLELPPPSPKNRSPASSEPSLKWKPTLIDEFLDESSQLRRVFFPGKKMVAGKGGRRSNYYPGRIWLDTDGNLIQAHGGGILHDERSSTYYWYGEYKDGPTFRAHEKGPARVDVIGVSCYSSKDLQTWKNEGIVLAAEQRNKSHDLHKSNVLERPKVIYNDKTGKYVMWMHIDSADYTKAAAGVAISSSPTGPFVYLYSNRPHGFESRDMTVFKDDNGLAYLVYSSERNKVIHIGPLTRDYLGLTEAVSRVLVGQFREAPALFKHAGKYYMITSGCSGWAPNEALAHYAGDIMGPWETIGNPCVGGNRIFRVATFFSQGTFVFPVPGISGWFFFMADRWNPADLRDSRYVWLPLTVRGETTQSSDFSRGLPMSTVSIFWHKKWSLPFY